MKKAEELFLSTPSARRATGVVHLVDGVQVISIHALREEGDAVAEVLLYTGWYFYPRPPRGGRRRSGAARVLTDAFLSTPSARRATLAESETELVSAISIHALREEGDKTPLLLDAGIPIFLSTPSARRATHHTFVSYEPMLISIHALREEGDLRTVVRLHAIGQISIHALREEGDRTESLCRWCPLHFYPRPPRGGRPDFS